MSKLEVHDKKIVQYLGLESVSIGAKFSEIPNARGIDRQMRIAKPLMSLDEGT